MSEEKLRPKDRVSNYVIILIDVEGAHKLSEKGFGIRIWKFQTKHLAQLTVVFGKFKAIFSLHCTIFLVKDKYQFLEVRYYSQYK